MTRQVLIAHAEGEEGLAEQLAGPIREAGYEVIHRDTVMVGESITAETSKALGAGAPVVLCATIKAVGTGWAHFLVNAARQNYQRARIFAVQMEKNVFIQHLSLDEAVAHYWQDPAKATRDLIAALMKYYPLDAGAGYVPVGPDAERRYRELALELCDIIDLANLPETDRHIATRQLELRRLYVPLRVQVELVPGAEDDEAKLELIERRREALRRGLPAGADAATAQLAPVGHRLREARRLIVLGDPGAGKTTMIRWLATAYLLRLKGDPDVSGLPDVETLPDEDWLPVIVRCRELDPAILTGSIDDALRQTLRKRELREKEVAALMDVLDARLREGAALLLVDGLDEITDPRLRARFCEQLEQFGVAYPRAAVVATSRIVGYREMGHRVGRGFEHVTVADLSQEEKDDFARRWSYLTEPPDRRESAAADLIRDIHSTDRIERLTGNPMLLTTMALVRRKVRKLPRRRADLYWEAVQVLLNWRAEVDEPVDPYEAVPQLEYIAYAMCDRGVQQLREDEIIELFDRMRDEYPQIYALEKHDSIEFLRLLERRTGMLVQAGYVRHAGRPFAVYEFRHLTFQEYLAARALVDGRFPGRDRTHTLAQDAAPLAGRVAERGTSWLLFGGVKEQVVVDSWRETLRLCVASCKDDDVNDVLLAIATPLPGEDASRVARPRAVEAALCLADEPNASDETARAVLRLFAAHIDATDKPLGYLGIWAFGGSSSLVNAAGELARSRWARVLCEVLLEEFRVCEPALREAVGAVYAPVAEAEAARVESDPRGWVAEQTAGITSGDDLAAICGALNLRNLGVPRLSLVGPGTMDALLSLLSGSAPVAHAAASALGNLYQANVWLPLLGQKKADEKWQPSDTQLALIRSFVADPRADKTVVANLLAILGDERDEKSVSILLDRLTDEEDHVRLAAARAVGLIGDERAIEPLTHALDDDYPSVGQAAASALGEFGVRVSAGLKSRLTHQSAYVRSAVLGALVRMRADKVEHRLMTELFNTDSSVVDPQEIITEERAAEAAAALNITAGEARRRYEVLADEYGLRLAWREGEERAG